MAYAHCKTRIATPIGSIMVMANDDVLLGIGFGDADADEHDPEAPLLRQARQQIEAYFAGRLTVFDLPLATPHTLRGGALRAAIVSIGYGDTLGYGALARQIGSSARAIGQACARNPFPLVVPCHRVLAADARLGHYSAGEGPETKAWLLRHEGAMEWRA